MPDVGQLPLQDLFDSLALLLTPLGVLALFLSGFLVINTISALMAQQVRQIGVMKAIGARRGQVVALYLGAVLIVQPAGAGHRHSDDGVDQRRDHVGFWAASSMSSSRPLSLPLKCAGDSDLDRDIWCRCWRRSYPVMKGTGITVREALSDYGSGDAAARWAG